MSEEWREIPGWPGYEVSDLGNVRSYRIKGFGKGMLRREPRPVRGGCVRRGYRYVELFNGSGSTKVSIHRLVLRAFAGPAPDGAIACHNNGNRTDNRASNLRWDSPSANQADRKLHGTHLFGEDNPTSKLSVEQVRDIRLRMGRGESKRSVAKLFSIDRRTVHAIYTRQTWAHLENE